MRGGVLEFPPHRTRPPSQRNSAQPQSDIAKQQRLEREADDQALRAIVKNSCVAHHGGREMCHALQGPSLRLCKTRSRSQTLGYSNTHTHCRPRTKCKAVEDLLLVRTHRQRVADCCSIAHRQLRAACLPRASVYQKGEPLGRSRFGRAGGAVYMNAHSAEL